MIEGGGGYQEDQETTEGATHACVMNNAAEIVIRKLAEYKQHLYNISWQKVTAGSL